MDSEPDLPEATQTPPPRSPAARVANTPKKTASTPRKPATPRQPRQNASAATDGSAPATPEKPTTPAKSTPKAAAKPTTAKPATARASSTRAATPRTTTPRSTTPRSTTPKAATAKPAADKSVAAPNAEKPPVKRAPTKRTATKTTKQADVTEPDVTTSTPSAAAAPDSAPTAESSAVESPAAETPAAQSPAAATSVPKVPAKRPVRRPAAKKTAVVEPTVESATAEPVVSEPVVSEAAVESSVIETVEPVEEPTTPETAVETTDETTAETTAVEKTGKAKKVRPVAAEAIENLRVVETDASGTEIVLKITGLVKRFDDKTAVAGIDLQIAAGSFFGIVGPNGAGKTTTLSMVTGLLKPDAGHITVHGADVWANPVVAKRTMGVLPDRLRLFDRLTGAQLLYYSGILHGLGKSVVRSRSADLAAAFGLEDSLDRLVTDYSAGMTKKIAIAAAMIHSPRLLVLDEPFESVDPVSAANVIEILQKYVAAGGTVVMSSHTMNLIERICDSVAVVVNGAVLATGTMDEVRGDKSLEDRFVELAGGRKAAEGMEWLHKFSD